MFTTIQANIRMVAAALSSLSSLSLHQFKLSSDTVDFAAITDYKLQVRSCFMHEAIHACG